ncbi:hypothetical protein EV182_006802, partial [Spiromyces aspiralis]
IVLAPAFVTLNAYAGSNVSSIWYIASYMLGYLPFLLIGARAYLDVSRIGAFVTGFALFLAFGAAAGSASRAIVIVVSRAFQAAGGGILSACAYLWTCELVPANSPARGRLRAACHALLTTAVLAGLGLSQIVGAAFVERGSWRWNHYVVLPFLVIPVLVTVFALEEQQRRPAAGAPSLARRLREFDWAGSALLTGAVVMVVTGLTFGGNEHRWDSAAPSCLIVFGVVDAGLFLAFEGLWARRPLLRVRRWLGGFNHQLAVLSAIFLGMATYSLFLYVPIFGIVVRHLGPIDAAVEQLAFWVPAVGTSLLCCLLAASPVFRHARRLAHWVVVPVGCALFAIGCGL